MSGHRFGIENRNIFVDFPNNFLDITYYCGRINRGAGNDMGAAVIVREHRGVHE